MRRTSTYLSFTFLIIFSVLNTVFGQTPGNHYGNTGNNANYALNAGDTLDILSGTYTGRITALNPGSVINVLPGATFQPSQFGNPKGKLVIYGTAKFNIALGSNNGFVLNNYGTMWVTSSVELNGTAQTWTNMPGANLRFDMGFTINNANQLINRGTITSNGSVTLNSGAWLTNKYSMTINGAFTNNGSTTLNEGALITNGAVAFNSGAVINNACRLIGTTFENNTTNVTNDGLLWAKAGSITNNGTITNGANGKVKAINFTNNGTIRGAGYFYFTGATRNNGISGVAAITADTLKIYDVSRTSLLTIFDIQYGVVFPNTVYRAFTAPDTINNMGTCSNEFLANIPLPVKWNYFFVNLSNNVPALNWSAENDVATVYEIERSYDGSNFSTIKNVITTDLKVEFRYDDIAVNTGAAIAYYRVKAIEPNGSIKYSDTRTIKFSNKTGIAVQTAPNPFTSQFSINYQSTERKMIAIRVFGLNGQLEFSKSVNVNNGFNSIAVTEAASLAKGMYMVQITDANGMIATERLIKH